MALLKPIPDSVDSIFHECIDTIEDADLRARLAGIKAEITRHDADFVAAAKLSQFYKIPTHAVVGGTVSQQEMMWLYESRMLKVKSARAYYDKIKGLPKRRRCPLCQHGTVSTLDHYMPKAGFPGLAVSPNNLLPSCGDCNKTKLADVPTCKSQQTINPYYDEIDDEVWMAAKVLKQPTVRFEYTVFKPKVWTRMKWLRLRAHFRTFGLGLLYSEQADIEHGEIHDYLLDLFDKAGEDALQEHLAEVAASRTRKRKNSCSAALYRALSTSRWYCKFGCKQHQPLDD